MRNILTITLTLLFVFFASTALADRGHGRGHNDGYASQGDRIERHLDRKGDRIEQRFEQKARRAANKGHYKQAKHFRAKGEQINRHLDRKGKRIHARHDYRYDNRRQRHQQDRAHLRVESSVRNHSYHDNYVGMVIRQPGLWFAWNTRY